MHWQRQILFQSTICTCMHWQRQILFQTVYQWRQPKKPTDIFFVRGQKPRNQSYQWRELPMEGAETKVTNGDNRRNQQTFFFLLGAIPSQRMEKTLTIYEWRPLNISNEYNKLAYIQADIQAYIQAINEYKASLLYSLSLSFHIIIIRWRPCSRPRWMGRPRWTEVISIFVNWYDIRANRSIFERIDPIQENAYNWRKENWFFEKDSIQLTKYAWSYQTTKWSYQTEEDRRPFGSTTNYFMVLIQINRG